MTHETLDETIDRVAGELSAVAGDPTMTAHVRERMHERRRPWVMPALAAASVVGVVVAMSVLLTQTGDPGAGPDVGELSSRALAPVAPLAAAVSQPDLFPASSDAAIVIPDEMPLAVAALVVPPLVMPEITVIEPLHIASLQIAEIEYEDPKEPR